MISAILSRLVILLFGTLYPAYASYKAVRTKNVKEYVKWMMYWIVFALFTCAETFTDVFFSFWFPFYYEIKIVLVIWLLSPATKGSSILYRNFVHPALTKREQEIDEYISKAKEQGYHTMLHLGSKGVTYATSVIMQTAIKGGGGIVNHLRRSYSLSDLSDDSDLKADLNRNSKLHGDTVDTADVPRDPRLRTPRKPGGSHVDLYFPEMDVDIRSSHHTHDLPVSLSQIRSSEDISSGYSSAEPLYGEGQVIPEGSVLMRTSSVGATRARVRGGRSTAQPRKALTTEEEDDGYTIEYGWQHALPPIPIASLFPELLNFDPLDLPHQTFLSPEALKLINSNSMYKVREPDIYEIKEENEAHINISGNIREDEIFEDAKPENLQPKENNEPITSNCSENLNIKGEKILPSECILFSVDQVVSNDESNISEEVFEDPLLSEESSNIKSVIDQSPENCLEDVEKNECFEDATDGENVISALGQSSTETASNSTNEKLKPSVSSESVASSNDQYFEDSLADATTVTADGSPNISDRKGKYNKGRAPPPPDSKKNDEDGVTAQNLPIHKVSTEPDPLMDSTTISLNKPESSTYPNSDNCSQNLKESNMQNAQKQYTNTSPGKKDDSSLSRFLPKTSVSSLFNFWGPKEGGQNSQSGSSNFANNTEYKSGGSDNESYSSRNEENRGRTTSKLKIRQMSQSPSRRRHHNIES